MCLKWPDFAHDGGVEAIMNDSHIESLEQVRQFLDGVADKQITIPSKVVCYRWIQGTPGRLRYLMAGTED